MYNKMDKISSFKKDADGPKTYILLLGQQELLKLVPKRLQMSGCQF